MLEVKLYKFTHPNGSESYMIARDLDELVADRKNKLSTPTGIDVVDKIEQMKDFTVTKPLMDKLGGW